MGNHLSIYVQEPACIFPESEELKETHIIQLAEKYPEFPKDILEDIDNHINILYHNKDDTDEKLQQISQNITKVNSSLTQNKQDLNVQFKDFIQSQDKTITNINKSINNNETKITNIINTLEDKINNAVEVNESLNSKIEGIDNTMTGIITNDWNVLDNDNENIIKEEATDITLREINPTISDSDIDEDITIADSDNKVKND